MDSSFPVVGMDFRVVCARRRSTSDWRLTGVPGVRSSEFGSEDVVPVVERGTQGLDGGMKCHHRTGHRFPGFRGASRKQIPVHAGDRSVVVPIALILFRGQMRIGVHREDS